MRFCDNLCWILVLIKFTSVFSVPHEFCLTPFDDKDCNERPTPVFYYYEPGSRCEIRMWKGCPTLNKFPDQYICSYFCLGRTTGQIAGEHDTIDFIEEDTAKQNWVEELETLDVEEMEIIEKLLEEIVPEHTLQKLSFLHKNETKTEEVETEKVETEGVETEEVETEAPEPEEAAEESAEVTTVSAETDEGEVEEVITT